MAVNSPIFLRIPTEIRMMIYEHLLATNEHNAIAIRNFPEDKKGDYVKQKCRSKYNIIDRTFARRSYQTTYYRASKADLAPAILAVNRQIREEASCYLYGKNMFTFGHDLEAVVPFMEDRTTSTRELVREISLQKKACGGDDMDADSYAWTGVCRYIKGMDSLKKLRVIVQAGLPTAEWEGPRQLSVSDLRLLYATKHQSLEWVRELAQIGDIESVEIVADMSPTSKPDNSASLISAAFSNSIETSLIEFMRADLGVPAVSPAMEAV